MRVTFHEYIGMAGDSHILLVGTTSDGRRESSLYNRFYLANFNRWRAEKRIIKRLELSANLFSKGRFTPWINLNN